MTREEKAKYQDKKAVAVYSMGLVGYEVLDIVYGIDDYIITRYSHDRSLHKTKIYYNNDRTYTKLYGRRVYMDECLRV